MLRIWRFPSPESQAFLEAIEQRQVSLPAELTEQVAQILDDVRREGDAAVLRYIREFDGVDLTPEDLRVPPTELQRLADQAPQDVVTALQQAADRIRRFHEGYRLSSWGWDDGRAWVGLQFRPLDVVGVYVPGGRAAYPSTVLMTTLPARVARVPRIVVCTPPRRFFEQPVLAAALRLAGVEEVYLVGGAVAIAAMAYGTATIPRVDKIVGPGNVYVAIAKRLVYGQVAIDAIAGPTELLVLCDETAQPAWVAADLLSQAEHDEHACVLCFTTSMNHAEAIAAEVVRQVEFLATRTTIEAALARGGIVVFDDRDAMVEWANRIAPEHVQVMTDGAEEAARRIRNAGAVFVGPLSSVVFGDYWAGANHVLPTAGTARFASPLGVYDFGRWYSWIRIHPPGVGAAVGVVERLAEAEGLPAHAAAARIRAKG
ncbi:Histidinol dehydrogenase [bacterium HR11]|nr:Histidinol dehydrogenase [bacterium HR11]